MVDHNCERINKKDLKQLVKSIRPTIVDKIYHSSRLQFLQYPTQRLLWCFALAVDVRNDLGELMLDEVLSGKIACALAVY